ncbi:Transcriptional regulator, MerR family [Rhodospirillaceae bacterium LM-1]|nr:Transcriptional regulator, MerR family [Rhodospirillaceae bacterium LM-1]
MGKSETAFRTISEVAGDLDIPQHVLRFWEGRFNQIKPLKRAGGRRYYRPEDVELLKRIRDLLYAQGYTIKGVQKLLRDKSGAEALGASPKALPAPSGSTPTYEAPKSKSVPIIAAAQLSLLPAAMAPADAKPEKESKTLLSEVLKELVELREILAAGAKAG